MTDTAHINRSRRRFLLGNSSSSEHNPIHPPWTDAASLLSACTGWGDCLSTCPEGILITGNNNFPEISFAENACTFCGKCAEACSEPVFAKTDSRAFSHVVEIQSTCLMLRGVECRSCAEACPSKALLFDYQIGPAGGIKVDGAACTGCGACLPICPVTAIAISRPDQTEAACPI